jgi:hypothetical protein
MIAKLGGFLARKCDGYPGTQTLWRGMRVLGIASQIFKKATNTPELIFCQKTKYG